MALCPVFRFCCGGYVVLTTDDEGFCKLASWQRERPAEGAYLKLKSQGPAYTWDKDKHPISHYNGVRFTFPFNKFYMDEAKAPVAETIVREGGRSTNCWANIRVLDGVGLIERWWRRHGRRGVHSGTSSGSSRSGVEAFLYLTYGCLSVYLNCTYGKG